MNFSKFRFTDARYALFVLTTLLFFSGATVTYINSVLTTLEKRFNFNSMELGILMGSNDIGYLSSVIFVTYFGSMKNRQPFMLFLSGILSWVSCMVYTIPYFMYGSKYSADALLNTSFTDGKGLCRNNSQGISLEKDIGGSVSHHEKSFAFAILIIAGIISGVSSTPQWTIGISFIDDLAGPVKSGIYIGTMYAIRTTSPIVGFLIGSQILKYHESLKIMVHQYSPGQKDLKWIGAWWLGWMIFGFCVLIPSPLILLIKKKKSNQTSNDNTQKMEFLSQEKHGEKETNENDLKNHVENENLKADIESSTATKTTLVRDLIELFYIIKDIFRNRIYTSLVIGMTFEIVGFVCLITFFTKYLEYHFRVSTSVANIMSGICLAGSRVVSSVVSGIVSYFYNPNLRNMSRFHSLVNIAAAIPYPILFLFTCPSSNIYGLKKEHTISMCSNNCNCQIRNMDPVCYNFTTVFTPCIAGCKTRFNETFYSNCGCDNSQFAYKGFCETMCQSVFGFLVVLFIVRIVGSASTVQITQVMMRLANRGQKALNLSLVGVIYGICGLVLPPLTGRILDTACKYRNINSYGVESHCLIYDNDKMRYLILGISAGLQIPACFFYTISWLNTPENYSSQSKNNIIKSDATAT